MSTEEENPQALRRNQVVRLWGTPDRTEGSLNDPRQRHEDGVIFNEKWVYAWPKGEPSRPRERIVYWQRYDFVGACRVEQDGHRVAEGAEILAHR